MLSFIKVLWYRLHGFQIGKHVKFGKGVKIIGKKVSIGKFTEFGNNVIIFGNEINIGDNCLFFDNIYIHSHLFKIGERGKISRNCVLKGYKIVFGKELWCNEGLDVGGGGFSKKSANLLVGDYVHIGKNVMINLCQKVEIGSCSGIGIGTHIFTHSSGHGQSILEGYMHTELPVKIGSHVSLFTGVIVFPGTIIEDNVLVGAKSIARDTLARKGYYIGMPVRLVRTIEKQNKTENDFILINMLNEEKYDDYQIYQNNKLIQNPQGAIVGVIIFYNLSSSLNSQYFYNMKLPICVINFTDKVLDYTRLTEIDMKTHQIRGITTTVSERLRDTFRRYGMILQYDDYSPNLLNSKTLKKFGIEL